MSSGLWTRTQIHILQLTFVIFLPYHFASLQLVCLAFLQDDFVLLPAHKSVCCLIVYSLFPLFLCAASPIYYTG